MNELDEIWPDLLADAIAKARDSGRGDVADFLALRASNDLLRTAAVTWLFDSMIEIASRAQGKYPNLTIEREEPHSFRHQGANLTGSLLELRLGVRCLTIEAGWTRLPQDGFMRGGALAFAKITHLGLPKQSMDIGLINTNAGPQWKFVGDSSTNGFETADIKKHFAVFLDE